MNPMSLAGRVIVDRTGLQGSYEFTLSFTQNPGPNSEHVDVFTALREQLGLELRGARGPVRMALIYRWAQGHTQKPIKELLEEQYGALIPRGERA